MIHTIASRRSSGVLLRLPLRVGPTIFSCGSISSSCAPAAFSTILSEAATQPSMPRNHGSTGVAIAKTGGSKRKVPGKIKRLIDTKPTSIEGRIRKMLELEKFMKQTGVRLELGNTKVWEIPALDDDLEASIEKLDSVEDHPAFWKHVNGYPLFNRQTSDWYRNLRVLIGGDGRPQCGIDVLHTLLDSIESKEDIKYAIMGMRTCRQRHLKFTHETSARIVEIFARVGALDKAIEIFKNAEQWRLFPPPATYSRLMKHAALAGDASLMAQVEKTMLSKFQRMHGDTVYSYVRGMLAQNELDKALHAVSRAKEHGEKMPGAVFTLIFDYIASSLESLPDDTEKLSYMCQWMASQSGNENFHKALEKAKAKQPGLFGLEESNAVADEDTENVAENQSNEAQSDTSEANDKTE